MRLLEAPNPSKLAVPPGLTKLEESMGKEFNVAERKAKALYKVEMAAELKEAPPRMKRKQSEAN